MTPGRATTPGRSEPGPREHQRERNPDAVIEPPPRVGDGLDAGVCEHLENQVGERGAARAGKRHPIDAARHPREVVEQVGMCGAGHPDGPERFPVRRHHHGAVEPSLPGSEAPERRPELVVEHGVRRAVGEEDGRHPPARHAPAVWTANPRGRVTMARLLTPRRSSSAAPVRTAPSPAPRGRPPPSRSPLAAACSSCCEASCSADAPAVPDDPFSVWASRRSVFASPAASASSMPVSCLGASSRKILMTSTNTSSSPPSRSRSDLRSGRPAACGGRRPAGRAVIEAGGSGRRFRRSRAILHRRSRRAIAFATSCGLIGFET